MSDMYESTGARSEFPPGAFISRAKANFPPAGPDQASRTVEIDARPWGLYRVTFKVMQNPRKGMRTWFWGLDVGERVSG